VIAEVARGGPAEGFVQEGDRLISVDGVDVIGLRSQQVHELIKGPPGTRVVFAVERVRGGLYTHTQTVTVNLTRGKGAKDDEARGKSAPMFPGQNGAGAIHSKSDTNATAENAGEHISRVKADAGTEEIIGAKMAAMLLDSAQKSPENETSTSGNSAVAGQDTHKHAGLHQDAGLSHSRLTTNGQKSSSTPVQHKSSKESSTNLRDGQGFNVFTMNLERSANADQSRRNADKDSAKSDKMVVGVHRADEVNATARDRSENTMDHYSTGPDEAGSYDLDLPKAGAINHESPDRQTDGSIKYSGSKTTESVYVRDVPKLDHSKVGDVTVVNATIYKLDSGLVINSGPVVLGTEGIGLRGGDYLLSSNDVYEQRAPMKREHAAIEPVCAHKSNDVQASARDTHQALTSGRADTNSLSSASQSVPREQDASSTTNTAMSPKRLVPVSSFTPSPQALLSSRTPRIDEDSRPSRRKGTLLSGFLSAEWEMRPCGDLMTCADDVNALPSRLSRLPS
jgi:hypothetical protein